LSTETAPLSRHYLYTELEIVLHGARDEMATALAEYDAACDSHQAEMESIRPALIASFGGLPLVDMYRQATIRHQKDRQIGAALAWCRRGIAFYGGQALRPEFESDLVRRAEKLQASLTTLPPKPPRAASTPRGPKATTETLVCATCGRRFERSITRGRKPHQCPECRSNLGAGL
jgi:hypothetical protein